LEKILSIPDKEEDIYIKMLRFGRAKLEKQEGIFINELVEHLKSNRFPHFSAKQTIMHVYFLKIFTSNEEDELIYNSGSSKLYYLRPDKYQSLLEYDNMLEARREARLSLQVAIVAIVLTFLSIVVSLIK
jgi:hypothetical protein